MRRHHLIRFIGALFIVGTATTAAQAQATKTQKKSQEAATKTAKAAAKAEERAENRAFEMAESQPDRLLHSIKLTKTERGQVNAIKKKYHKQLSDMHKAHETAEKAGKGNDAQAAAEFTNIADQERAELRAVLTAAQQATFDKNAAKIKK